jgi:hypothetical protein
MTTKRAEIVEFPGDLILDIPVLALTEERRNCESNESETSNEVRRLGWGKLVSLVDVRKGPNPAPVSEQPARLGAASGARLSPTAREAREPTSGGSLHSYGRAMEPV